MKKGVSVVVVLVAVVIMLILVTSVSVVGSSAISSANFEKYISEIKMVSDLVNVYVNENNRMPVTNEIVSTSSLGIDFVNAVKEKGDISNDFYVVDLSKLDNYTIKSGKSSVADRDVYVVATNTNNVYYLKGFKYKGKVYYTF